jgi:acetyl esterase
MSTTPIDRVFDPVTRAFVAEVAAAPQPHELTLEAARQSLVDLQASTAPLPHVTAVDWTIPAEPIGHSALRIVRPAGVEGELPVIMYFHGGGWVLGDRGTHDRIARELAVRVGAAVVFVEYARSPEARYPVAVEQSYAATRWVAEHGAAVYLDGSRIALAGDSSGGNLAAAVALLAAGHHTPNLVFQLLLFPALDPSMDTASYREYSDGPFLTRAQMEWFWQSYAPGLGARPNAIAAPLHASAERLRGLPRTLVITAEHDVLRDEGEAYTRRLVDAGVDATATRYLNTIHSFLVLEALAPSPPARAALAQATAALRDAFGVRSTSTPIRHYDDPPTPVAWQRQGRRNVPSRRASQARDHLTANATQQRHAGNGRD